jgi:hypothetical protein
MIELQCPGTGLQGAIKFISMSQRRGENNKSSFSFGSFAESAPDPQKSRIYSYASEHIKESMQDGARAPPTQPRFCHDQ